MPPSDDLTEGLSGIAAPALVRQATLNGNPEPIWDKLTQEGLRAVNHSFSHRQVLALCMFLLFGAGSTGCLIASPPHQMYYPSGQLKERGQFVETQEGQKVEDGVWKYWFNNGQLQSIASFKAGVPHGDWTLWNEDGRLLQQGGYTNGRESGPWTVFWDSGDLRMQGTYINALEEGPWTFWDVTGTPTMAGTFSAGQWNGLWTTYYPSGKKRTKTV